MLGLSYEGSFHCKFYNFLLCYWRPTRSFKPYCFHNKKSFYCFSFDGLTLCSFTRPPKATMFSRHSSQVSKARAEEEARRRMVTKLNMLKQVLTMQWLEAWGPDLFFYTGRLIFNWCTKCTFFTIVADVCGNINICCFPDIQEMEKNENSRT